MSDQRTYWDRWHERHNQERRTDHAGDAREQFIATLDQSRDPANMRILEIGCGQGHDAIELARHGFHVTALDHSSVAIRRATDALERHEIDGTVFWESGDCLTRVSQYPRMAFDGVYAHLSLHYFTDVQTNQLIEDIYHALKPGGVLLFTVRAVTDPLYGQGRQIGTDHYVLKGHVRRFFDEACIRRLLSGWQTPRLCAYVGRDCSNESGMFLRATARRPTTRRSAPAAA